jgi:tRNA (mo5U34)-methyltransferase
MTTPHQLQAEAARYQWFRQVGLGQGVVTPAQGPLPWQAKHFPRFEGRSVLDIGAWDGAYSFLAEREGASRVVALDHYVWGVDMEARQAYWRDCTAQGVLPDHSRDTTDFWDMNLPGKQAFDFARRVLGSNVETVVADFMTCDPNALGAFDVVLFLGVLYHMPEPLSCLQRVRALTRHVAVVASVAVDIPSMNDQRLLQFNPGNELAGDYGNWFVPTISALEAMCRAAGFRRIEIVVGPSNRHSESDDGLYLAMVHAHVT